MGRNYLVQINNKYPNLVYKYNEVTGFSACCDECDDTVLTIMGSPGWFHKKNSNSDLYILTRKLSFMGKKLRFGRTALPSLRIALCGSIIYEKVDLDERIIPIKNENKIKKINAYIIDKPNISFFEWKVILKVCWFKTCQLSLFSTVHSQLPLPPMAQA